MGLTSLYKFTIIINIVENMSNPAKKIAEEKQRANWMLLYKKVKDLQNPAQR